MLRVGTAHAVVADHDVQPVIGVRDGHLRVLGGGVLTYAVCALALAAGVLLLWRVPVRYAAPRQALEGSMWQRATDGFHFIRSRPIDAWRNGRWHVHGAQFLGRHQRLCEHFEMRALLEQLDGRKQRAVHRR